MHPRGAQLREGRSRGPLVLVALALLAGASVRAQPATEGQWTLPAPWPDNATHTILLPTGKVMTWNEFAPEEFHLWDPATGAITLAPHPGYNMFCSGHALLADGRLLVSGGHIDTNRGLPNASIYDPFTNTWERLPDMTGGRWYPTNTALPNGEMLVTGGTISQRRTDENRLPQVWEPGTKRWRDLSGALRAVNQYSMMFVAPNGKVFMAGPDPISAYLDTSGTGSWTDVGPRAAGENIAGSAVMYDDGKVMVSGGGEAFPVATVEVIDLNSPTPAWRTVEPMGQPRKQHNMTLLPDGTVLVTGGSSGPGKDDDTSPVFPTELWDPATEKFTVLAPSRKFRGYHSTALLLQDGRVLSMGGQQSDKDVEVFSPPYLFKGARPTITAAPAVVGYGETFTVSTPNADSIRKVTWLRAGSVTHAFNQNQRINHLAFTRDAGGLRVTAPATSNLAPPGDYMLFVLNEQGVPSVAHWVKVGGPDMQPAPEVPGVGLGEVWRYDERGSDPGEAWTSAGFDDSQWKSGRGSFATGGQAGTLLQLKEGQPGVSFRKKLLLHGAAQGGRLKVVHDDGVEVWLNGNLVFSRNVGTAGDHGSYASEAGEAAQVSEATLPAGALLDGENQLAVRVKRVQPSEAAPNPELRFDLELWVATLGEVEPAPVLTLTSPNGGERLESGSTFPVRWQTDGTLATVRLEYSVDGGGSWSTLESSLPNTGSYAWQVPQLESAQVLLRVVGTTGPATADASDAPFSIMPAAEGGCSGCPQGPEDGSSSPDGRGRAPTLGCAAAPTPSVLGLLAALAWALRRRGAVGGRGAASRAQGLSLLLLPLLLLGCGERQVSIRFAAQVRGEPLRCDATYEGIGATGTTLQLLDFKAYVRSVVLVRKNGERHLMQLEQDGRWQRDLVALLDFEDGTGSCNTGSPEVRTEVVGKVPDFDDYTGVEFTLGVPPELNHMNAEWVDPPLNEPSMWWSWKNGYKFLRIDVRSGGNRPYSFHVGADGCEGTPDTGVTCSAENQGRIALKGFDPEKSRIVFDLAALLAHADLEHAGQGEPGSVAGCLSSAADPECPALLAQVGLGGEATFSSGPEAFIRVE